MKSISRSPTPDCKRSFLEALRGSDSRLRRNEGNAISRIKLLAEQGRRVLDKLSPLAHEALFSNQALRDRFLAAKSECAAFILSIDIRRSTELMLKARSAELFGEFMAGLCD